MNTIDMSNDYKGLLVVIPTRNRADLAINAILSVLNQPDCEEVQVLVSDNSTDLKDIEILHKFCQENDNKRLKYIKPPEPLSMSKHWDWAINQALEKYPINHFLYLTDRMIFKTGQLQEVRNIAKRYPEYIISYDHDRVADDKKPVKLEQMNWTGKLHRVKSTRLLGLSAQAYFHASLPRMLNNVAPRSVLNQISNRFENIFSSTSPDFNFCYRSLGIVDSILYFDKAVIVHYAILQSNGASFAKGVMSKASSDFVANLSQSQFCLSSPIPALQTVGNAIWHEYCILKQEIGSDRFPDINMSNYLNYIAGEVKQIENPDLKIKMEEILSSHQNRETLDVKDYSPIEKALSARNLSMVFKKLLSPNIVWNKIVTISSKNPYISSAFLFLSHNLGIRPPSNMVESLNFNTTGEALYYINKFPKSKSKLKTYLTQLLGNDYLEID